MGFQDSLGAEVTGGDTISGNVEALSGIFLGVYPLTGELISISVADPESRQVPAQRRNDIVGGLIRKSSSPISHHRPCHGMKDPTRQTGYR